MSKKQFLLILLIWSVVMSLIFCTPARSSEVGLISPSFVLTCKQSAEDGVATVKRIDQLKAMIKTIKGQSNVLVLETEIKALKELVIKINWWRNENCRDA